MLEVGCGEGHLAIELSGRGYCVTAIDSDPEVAARARALGAGDVVCAEWPGFAAAPVEAVAFTRSLHHIGSLGAAIDAAHAALRPRGVLLVEDFAFDEADAAAIGWFVGVLRSALRRSLVAPTVGGLVAALLEAREPTAAWSRHHDHDLHAPQSMQRAIASRFGNCSVSTAPYLYRYLVPIAAPDADGAAFIAAALDEERRLATSGRIVPIGRRFVATAPG